MVNALTRSLGVLIGLLLGCLIAVALAWYGARLGADSLKRDVWTRVWAVQDRQQTMADEALELQPLFERFGFHGDADVFRDVENQRSLLAGDATLDAKLAHEQWLEEALLRSEKVWALAGKREPRLAAWPSWSEHGRVWRRQERLLVVEENRLDEAVEAFNGLLLRWPFSVLLAHSTLSGLGGSLIARATGRGLFMVRVGLDWAGYSLRRLAALVGQKPPPPAPAWGGKAPVVVVDQAYARGMTPPVFLADAPLPEGDYPQIQYTRAVPVDYADVALGGEKPVMNDRHPPAPYTAPRPSPQTTVMYNAPD